MTRHPTSLPVLLLVLLAGAITTSFLLLAERTPAIQDTIGYTYAAERLAEGEGLTLVDGHNTRVGPFFTMYAFPIRQEGQRTTHYFGFPPGFPLLLALGAMAGVPHLLTPLLAGLGLLAAFLLGRLSNDSVWAGLWAALLLGLSPAYWTFSTAAWSEIPSLTFVAAGFACYLLSRRAARRRETALFGVLAALFLGYSFFIRYANVVTVLPAIAGYELLAERGALLGEWWRRRERWPFLLVLGVALLAIPLFNELYYGGFLTTNYSPLHGWYPQPPFSPAYALGPSFVNGYSAPAALSTLWQNFGPLLLLAPLGWLLLPRPAAALNAAAALATLALYAVYAFAASGINSRFLLPAFPFLTVGMGAALLALGGRLPGPRWRWSATLALLALLTLPLPGRVAQLQARNDAGARTAALARRVAGNTEHDAVLLSYVYNDQLYYYGQRSVLNYRRIPPSDADAGRYRWELFEPCLNASVSRLLQQQTPVYYVEDQTPSYAGSLDLLQSRFDLQLVDENPNLYRITQTRPQAQDTEQDRCPLLTSN